MKSFTDFLQESRLSKNLSLQDIAKKHDVTLEYLKKQLDAGIKVEKEHTDSKEQAAKIAKDHLVERPDYYEKLSKLEKSKISFADKKSAKESIEHILSTDLSESRKFQILLALEQRCAVALKYCKDNKQSQKLKESLDTYRGYLYEDAPVNNVGSGNIAGIVPGEAPPVRKRKKIKYFQRGCGNVNKNISGDSN